MRGIVTLGFAFILAASAQAGDLRHMEDATIRAIQFVDEDEGWAVGDEGVIWHTINRGKTWERIPSGTRASLRSVCFVSPFVGWIAGREELSSGQSTGVVLYTDDAGETWKQMLPNSLPGLNRIRFPDARNGYLVGDGTDQLPGGVFHTADGGRSWKPITGPRTQSWLDGDFVDGSTGVMVGLSSQLGYVHKQEAGSGAIDNVGVRNVRGVRMIAGGRSVAVGDGGLLIFSNNHGADWGYVDHKLPRELMASLDLQAIDSFGDHVWAVGRPGTVILHSANQGRTWDVQKSPTALPLYTVYFRNATHGWAAGALGVILHTTDGGKTWEVQRRGGDRTAVLFLQSRAKSFPAESIGLLGLEEGYLIAGTRVFTPSKNAEPAHQAPSEFRLLAGLRRAGAACAESMWPFPLPPHMRMADRQAVLAYMNKLHGQTVANQMLKQIVLAIRIWRPDVIITDSSEESAPACDQLTAEAVQRAFELAADPKAYPEQITQLGLNAWSVSKAFGLSSEKQDAQVCITSNDVQKRLQSTLRDFAIPASLLLAGTTGDVPPKRHFRLLASRMEGAAGQSRLMAGLELKADNGARREMPKGDLLATAEIEAALKKRQQLQNLIDNPVKGLVKHTQLAAHINGVLRDLPPEQGATAAFAIANRYAQNGQWQLAQETFVMMVDRYPMHPLTANAYRWLIQHNTSSEVRRRYELSQFKANYHVQVHDVASTTKQLVDNFQQQQKVAQEESRKRASKRGDNQEVIQKVGHDEKAGAPTRLPPLVQVPISSSSNIDFLANEQDQKKQIVASLEYAKQLAGFGAIFADDPAIQFCVQSARRQLGEFQEADRWYNEYAQTGSQSPWQAAAAAEKWLAYPGPRHPKPYMFCRKTSERPFLDGRFDDPCWQNIKPTVLTMDGNPAIRKDRLTEVRFAYDDDFLYIALTCTNPAEAHIPPAKARPRDADLESFDRVSIILDLDRDYSTYFHLQVDQRGCVREDCWGDVHWNPRWFVAVRSTTTTWSIEAAIPLGQLTGQRLTTGTTWACNVVRITPGEDVQAVSQPAGPEPIPQGMGLLLFRDQMDAD